MTDDRSLLGMFFPSSFVDQNKSGRSLPLLSVIFFFPLRLAPGVKTLLDGVLNIGDCPGGWEMFFLGVELANRKGVTVEVSRGVLRVLVIGD